jgi:hypothetical protein
VGRPSNTGVFDGAAQTAPATPISPEKKNALAKRFMMTP